MGNLKNALKKASKNGSIKEEAALKVAEVYEDQLTRAAEYLAKAQPHFGLFIGGEISMLLAEMRGHKFNEAAYFYNKEPEGQ